MIECKEDEKIEFPLKKVNTFVEFLSVITEMKEALEKKAEELGVNYIGADIWYRGHARKNFTLTPSLFRFICGPEIEKDLFQEYKRLNKQDVKNNDDWGTLYEMQHYFVPTRLLDWTTSHLVALYFAFNSEDSDFPCVFLLHPGILNAKAKVRGELNDYKPFLIHESQYEYQRDYLNEANDKPSLPFAIVPPLKFDRLEAQSGMFTIHGKVIESIEILCPEALAKIEFHNVDKVSTINYLKNAGTTAFSIFPDHTGLAMFLKEKFGLKPYPEKQIITVLKNIWKHDQEEIKKETGQTLHVQGIKGCIIDDMYIERDESTNLENWLKDESKPFAVLTGTAASGKTNLLVNMIFKDDYYVKRPIIYYSLNSYRPHEHSIFSRIADSLEGIPLEKPRQTTADSLDDKTSKKSGQISVSALKEMVKDGRILLILDGLDELARIQGENCVFSLEKDLNLLFEPNKLIKPKIIIACRDHIFKRFPEKGGIMRNNNRCEHIKVENLSTHKIKERLQASFCKKNPQKELMINNVVLEIIAAIPLFYSALCKILGEANARVSSIRTKADLWEIWIGLSTGSYQLVKGNDYVLMILGKVAVDMLKKRNDYLDDQSLGSNLEIVKKLTDNKFPIFVRESNNMYRFIHQAIREYTLAWNMKHGFENPKNESVLTETASFDYESAETYLYLKELLPGNSITTVVEKLGVDLKAMPQKKEWNNFMRNYFEAVGMFGISDDKILDLAISQAKKVIEYPLSGKEHRASFKTKFNAARCLCRLHPTSPPVYCEHVLTYNWQENPDGHLLVYGYAVRGFQMSKHCPGEKPPEVFFELKIGFPDQAGISSYLQHKKHRRQAEISECLIKVLEYLSVYEELHPDGEFLKINASHALIRWFDPQEPSIKRMYRLLAVKNLPWEVKANLMLSLYIHGVVLPEKKDAVITSTKGKNSIILKRP
ncbi:MAG: hypothetical protein QG657_4185 [Acidobacteriota bacterium]|nr:hypothetical protein [Acidobacteriota bacterium]